MTIKKLALIIFAFTLVLASFTPHGLLAITQDDLRAINLQAPLYYGEIETTQQQLCGTTGTDEYPLLLPEILDEQALADAIDTYIEGRQSNSPYVGLGEYFVEGGVRGGISPILVVALAVAESSLGTDPNTTAINLGGNNGFGRTASSSQPYVQLNEDSRRWYAWDSWEDSLYAANFPASGDEGDPDDMFQYINRRFSGNLENGIESFLVGTDDVPGYLDTRVDDVPRYMETIETVTNGILEEAEDSVNLDRISITGLSCGIYSDDVVAAALLYAWPEYRSLEEWGAQRREQREEYAAAHRAAAANGEYLGGCSGNDCGAFVTRVMRNSGFDTNYNSYEGATPLQTRYLEESWEVVGRGNEISSADLVPGDVAMRTGHTFMFVGNQPGFETEVASASYSSRGCSTSGVRAPMAGRESIVDSRLTWYRNPDVSIDNGEENGNDG